MRKIISLAVLLAVVALLLVTAVPALANGEAPPEYSVQPTLGGPNNPHTHIPPGEPTVRIPADNPAIGEDPLNPQPGEVFWP
jgi:hypothetical protein